MTRTMSTPGLIYRESHLRSFFLFTRIPTNRPNLLLYRGTRFTFTHHCAPRIMLAAPPCSFLMEEPYMLSVIYLPSDNCTTETLGKYDSTHGNDAVYSSTIAFDALFFITITDPTEPG